MDTRTPAPHDDTRPDVKTWLITAGALVFCVIIAPGIAEFAAALIP